ncbi:acyltransferase [Kosakonia sp. H7A]|uniref:acyltransferase family protein n=1 Tax=Kosakonia TaxID=1330547 RepID=UPI000D15B1D7|nr:acyltransferase family protein [Kosakonia sp. H7A]PTA91701.1 acyltransferase [Kosakonia sp. H7A]
MESTVNDFVAEQKKEIVRDKSLDVAKGLLMASVVAGHIAYFPFAEMFYYYHVAGFFLLSGFFFNYDKYANSFISFIFSRKKILTQYFSYSLLFILLHNHFVSLNILPENAVEYTTSDMMLAFINSITIPSEPLLGAMWFIPVLVIMQIIFYTINKASKTFTNSNLLPTILIVFLFFFGWWLVKSKYISDNINLYRNIPNAQFFVYLPFFYIGYLFKDYGLSLLKSKNILVPCLTIMLLTYIYLRPALYLYGETDPFLFIFLSLISIAVVIGASHYIKTSIVVNFLKYIGENTVHILALHFLFFKVGSFILIRNNILNENSLHTLGTAPGVGLLAKMLYLFCGILGPLLVLFYSTKMKRLVFKTA